MTTEVRAIFEAHQLPIPTATPRGMDEAWVGSCMPNAIGEICIWLRAQMINTAPPTSLNGAGVGAIHGGSQSRTRGASLAHGQERACCHPGGHAMGMDRLRLTLVAIATLSISSGFVGC